ncbi:hypothetical protein Z950_2277 [Sulfitobacter mediterraneus KCTC 32188]|nr:hypothetical protein Z950_2277 [Sulfitobacter mediterraneus KCTC 32188]
MAAKAILYMVNHLLYARAALGADLSDQGHCGRLERARRDGN